MSKPIIDIRRSGERFRTRLDWLDSYHSFSFANHYDPANTHHGLLLVSNDDVIQAGSGFRTHPHQDMEIVTWVLDGELEHKDSVGNKDIIYPGLAQRMSAGTGIWHSEMNPRGDRDVHLIQMWVLPDTERIAPGYQQLDINGELAKGGLMPIASGRGQPLALRALRRAGESVNVPDARFVHLYLAKGAATLEGAGALRTGDAVRLTAAGSPRLSADAGTGAEVLLWENQ